MSARRRFLEISAGILIAFAIAAGALAYVGVLVWVVGTISRWVIWG